MFIRVTPPIPVSSSPVVIKRQVEVPTSNGVDVVYTDKEEPLPPYDAYSVESLSAAGVPLQAVNPAVLDTVDISAVNDFVSRETKPLQQPDSQTVTPVVDKPIDNPIDNPKE